MKIIVFTIIYLSLASNVCAGNQIYAVQVLMAREYINAVSSYEDLKDHQESRIEKINDAYFVRIGAYQTKTKALALLKQLKTTYPDAFLIKYIVDKQSIVLGDQPNDHQKAKNTPSVASTNPIEKYPDIPTHPATRIPISVAEKIPESSKPPKDPKPLSDVQKPYAEITKQTTKISSELKDLQDLSTETEEHLLKSGMQNYYEGNYESTVSSLSKYVSLVPKSEQCAAALLIIGKSLEQLNRPKSALGLYGRLLDQYPDRPESLFGIVAMADISVNNPGLHYPIGKKGAEYFRDPVSAYDTVLLKNVPSPMIEHIHYQKGLALWKLKRYEPAREAYADFLIKFPNTAYRKEIILMLKDSTAILINQHRRSGDHISVANLFLYGWKNGLITTEDVDTLLTSSISLSYLGLHDVSLNILNALKKSAMGKTSDDIDKAVAEIEKKRAIGLMAQLPPDAKWNKFQSGREYLSANNITKAEQTFSELTSSDGDQFWSKITQYALEQNKWTQKYRATAEKQHE